jgi:hypothetical protein
LQQERDELLGQVQVAQRATAKAEASELRARRELATEFREKSQELERFWELQLDSAHEGTAAAQQEVMRLEAEASAAARREASLVEAAKAAKAEAFAAAGRISELQEQVWALREVATKEEAAAAEQRCRLQQELCAEAAAASARELALRQQLDEVGRLGDTVADTLRYDCVLERIHKMIASMLCILVCRLDHDTMHGHVTGSMMICTFRTACMGATHGIA